jgi:hypothetical protein
MQGPPVLLDETTEVIEPVVATAVPCEVVGLPVVVPGPDPVAGPAVTSPPPVPKTSTLALHAKITGAQSSGRKRKKGCIQHEYAKSTPSPTQRPYLLDTMFR